MTGYNDDDYGGAGDARARENGGGRPAAAYGARFAAVAPLYPSEDPARVGAAVDNVFEGEPRHGPRFSVARYATDVSSLGRVRDSVRTGAESRSAYRRNLENNMGDDSVWFYLNKQAAFAGRVAICQEADESPLGPIKITVSSCPNPERIAAWILG